MLFLGLNPIFEMGDIGLLLSILTTILGVLVTVLALLYSLESLFVENETVQMLKARGKHVEVYERFNDSIKAVFYTVIIYLIAYFLPKTVFDMLGIILQTALLSLLIWIIIRTYRCFFLFRLLEQRAREAES